MRTPKILYVTECGHVNPGAHNVGNQVFCFECVKQKTIIDVHVWEWKTWCETESCPFARYTGLSKDAARFLADQHARRHPDHRVLAGYRINETGRKVRDRRRINGTLSY